MAEMHLGERPGTTSSRSGSVASCLGLNRVEPTAWGASVAEPRFNGQDTRRRPWGTSDSDLDCRADEHGAPRTRRTYDDQSTVICTFQSTLVNAKCAAHLQVPSYTNAHQRPRRVLAGLLVRVQSGEPHQQARQSLAVRVPRCRVYVGSSLPSAASAWRGGQPALGVA